MQRKSLDLWVGLFVLLGAAALFFLAMKAGNMSTISFAQTYPVITKFDNIGGLKPRAPVKSAGVVVGRVGSIAFDNKNFQATITLNMESAYQFPSETSAAILTSGLLGEQYIGLTPGAEIGITRVAPMGDPIEIRVRGFALSLRKEEAAALDVEKV